MTTESSENGAITTPRMIVSGCASHATVSLDVYCCMLFGSRVMVVLSSEFSVCLVRLKFHLARLDSTHSTCRAHAFWLCRASRRAQLDSLDTSSSTGSTWRTRLAQLARHVELDWLDTSSSTGATCNLVMITVIHLLISYSLINWSIH